MSLAAVPEAIAGLALVFFVPGYFVTKATFPEWRIRGPDGLRRLLEIGTLSFVLSVGLTVLVGGVLLAASPGGFQAYWSDPVLEAGLTAVALLAFAIGWVRGAFARTPPAPHPLEPSGGEEGAWELSRELDRLAREERRLLHQLRTGPESEAARVKEEVARVRAEISSLQSQREAAYAE